MRLARHDSTLPGYPVLLTVHGATIRLTLEQARQLHDELGGALMQAEPPDTDPAPPGDDTPTRPSSPEARRKSSGSMQAITPEAAEAFRAAAEIAKGRE